MIRVKVKINDKTKSNSVSTNYFKPFTKLCATIRDNKGCNFIIYNNGIVQIQIVYVLKYKVNGYIFNQK